MTDLDTLLIDEKDRLNKEMRNLEEEISLAERRRQEIQFRLQHVDALLGASDSSETVTTVRTSHSRNGLMDLAEEILQEMDSEPMHYKDLAREIQTRGGNLSGENAPNILVARLVNDERFVRPLRKGFYALREDYPNAKNVGARKRRRS